MIHKKQILKIGVDISSLSENLTGIGRYTHEILNRVLAADHQWFLYSHHPLAINNWSQKNVHFRIGCVPISMKRIFWMQSTLPFMVAKDELDVFWSPSHRLSLLLPSKIAKVVTIHDLVWKYAGSTMRPLNRWLDAALMPHAIRIADKVITVSAHTANDVINEMPYAREKISTISLGASILNSDGEPSSLKLIGSNEPYILFVGTLEPRKNLVGLIEAFSKLPLEIRNSALLVIVGGKGWGGVDAVAIARKFDVSDRIRVLGYVTDAELASLYRFAIFLAMPSFYEGFGLPILEAMARGTPVLTSNCSSMPEVAGDAAIFIDPYDLDSLSKALHSMLIDKTLINNLRAKSIKNAQRYSWDRASEKTLKIFEKVFENRELKNKECLL